MLRLGHSLRRSAERWGTWWMLKEQHERSRSMVGRILAVEECEKRTREGVVVDGRWMFWSFFDLFSQRKHRD